MKPSVHLAPAVDTHQDLLPNIASLFEADTAFDERLSKLLRKRSFKNLLAVIRDACLKACEFRKVGARFEAVEQESLTPEVVTAGNAPTLRIGVVRFNALGRLLRFRALKGDVNEIGIDPPLDILHHHESF